VSSPGKLTWKRGGAIGFITFDNPARFNAITLAMWQDLPRAVAEFEADPQVHSIVLMGAGERAFISGADVSQFATERSGDKFAGYQAAMEAAYSCLLQCSKPTIAAIRGVCMGAGLGIAANCDVRICADDARFRMPVARIGIGYSIKGIERFVQLIGQAYTAEIFFSARFFNATEALQMGLVNRVSDTMELEVVADELAQAMAENAPLTVAAVKRTLLELRKPAGERDFTLAQAMMDACSKSEDYKEGQAAFAAKRRPRFTGK
jgi:enoyl-CoA hydratase